MSRLHRWFKWLSDWSWMFDKNAPKHRPWGSS